MQFIVHKNFKTLHFEGKKTNPNQTKTQTKTSTQMKYANIDLFTTYFELRCKVMKINLPKKKKCFIPPIYISNY